MEIKKLSLEINRRFDTAVNQGRTLASLGLLGLSYPLEVGAAIAGKEWWYAARLVLFLPLLAPTGVIATVVLSALAKWKPFKLHQ